MMYCHNIFKFHHMRQVECALLHSNCQVNQLGECLLHYDLNGDYLVIKQFKNDWRQHFDSVVKNVKYYMFLIYFINCLFYNHCYIALDTDMA